MYRGQVQKEAPEVFQGWDKKGRPEDIFTFFKQQRQFRESQVSHFAAHHLYFKHVLLSGIYWMLFLSNECLVHYFPCICICKGKRIVSTHE